MHHPKSGLIYCLSSSSLLPKRIHNQPKAASTRPCTEYLYVWCYIFSAPRASTGIKHPMHAIYIWLDMEMCQLHQMSHPLNGICAQIRQSTGCGGYICSALSFVFTCVVMQNRFWVESRGCAEREHTSILMVGACRCKCHATIAIGRHYDTPAWIWIDADIRISKELVCGKNHTCSTPSQHSLVSWIWTWLLTCELQQVLEWENGIVMSTVLRIFWGLYK